MIRFEEIRIVGDFSIHDPVAALSFFKDIARRIETTESYSGYVFLKTRLDYRLFEAIRLVSRNERTGVQLLIPNYFGRIHGVYFSPRCNIPEEHMKSATLSSVFENLEMILDLRVHE